MSSDLYAVAGTNLSSSQHKILTTTDFCLVPIGTSNPSVAEEIAECQRVLERSGLTFKMHGYGTNLEGPWFEVSKVIHDCHLAVHATGAVRISTNIRMGTRTDRFIPTGTGNESKVRRVNEILKNS